MLKNPKYIYCTHDIEIPISINFGEFMINKLNTCRDRVALINAGANETITYGEILDKTINLAVSLYNIGCKKGQTVAICSENRFEFFPSVIGASCTGAVVSPISVISSKDEMKHLLSICKANYIICSPMTYKIHSKVWKSTPHVKKIIIFGNERPDSTTLLYSELIAKNVAFKDFLPADVVGQKDTGFILYSSGTTGLPKGVMISHYSAIVTCACMKPNPPGFDEIRTLAVAPWYHAMGFWSSLGAMFRQRTSIYLPKFQEEAYLAAIQRYQPHILTAPPPVLVLLSKSQIIQNYDLSSVFLIVCGAAPLDSETIADVKKWFPSLFDIAQGYGMTEATLAVTMDSELSVAGVKSKSAGVAMPATTVKIVDIDTREPLGPNQRGEILFKSPTTMQGYVGKNNSEYFDQEGFFLTGDVGYYDEDKYVYIVDRLKELIKYKGFQVAPAELEAILLQHPSVRDAAVIGKPDRTAGELPMAFVVLQPGSTTSEEDIKKFVAENVSNPKQLRGGVVFVDEIPKNPSGKILRKDLRKLLKKTKSKL